MNHLVYYSYYELASNTKYDICKFNSFSLVAPLQICILLNAYISYVLV